MLGVAKLRSWLKAALGALVGLLSGAAAVYGTALFDRVVKPNKPVANFAVTVEDLTVSCHNRASGETGWWDFGDGTPLEPFDPELATVTHLYSKPGSYHIKLLVRNFLAEENERSVPVDLTSVPQSLPPTITGLKIEPIGSRAIAPATFRIRGEVRHADRVIWDLGDNRLDVTTEPGPFDRLVVFERPGQYPIALIGHAGKQAVKQGATVSVGAASAGNISVVMGVRDVAQRVETQTILESVPMPSPAPGTRRSERTVPARPGHTIREAKLGKYNTAVFKTVLLQVAPDQKSVQVLAEWALDAPNTGRAGSGAPAIVPLTLTEEKPVRISYPPATIAGQMSQMMGQGTVQLRLPPPPTGVSGLTRTISLDVREAGSDGRPMVLASTDSVKFPFQVQFTRPTGRMSFTATQVGQDVQIRIAPANGR